MNKAQLIDKLDLERIPLSLRFNTKSIFRKELINRKQRGLVWAINNHKQFKSSKTKQLLLEAIRQADRALWR